jgi:hypothetical protein
LLAELRRSPAAGGELGPSGFPFASLIREYTSFENKCKLTVFAAAADAPTVAIAAHATSDAPAHLIRLMVLPLLDGLFPGPAPGRGAQHKQRDTERAESSGGARRTIENAPLRRDAARNVRFDPDVARD